MSCSKENSHENKFVQACLDNGIKRYGKALVAFRAYRRKVKESRYQGEMI